MQVLIFILIILIIPKRFSFYSNFDTKTNQLLDDDWALFKHEHNKHYSNRLGHFNHELKRRLIWEANMRKINLHNDEYYARSETHTHLLKMNSLGDLTHEEFSQRNGFIPSDTNHTENHIVLSRYKRYISNPPSSVDWRAKGLGMSYQNQQQFRVF